MWGYFHFYGGIFVYKSEFSQLASMYQMIYKMIYNGNILIIIIILTYKDENYDDI